MKIKFLLPAIAALAFQACNDGVTLPEWEYPEENTVVADEIISEGNVPVDSVYFEITSHTHYSLDQYLDSMLVIYPQLSGYKQTVFAITSTAMELDSYSFLYKSKDENGRDITLSALLVVPDKFQELSPHRLVVDNRATQTCDALVPSNALNFTEIFACMGHPVVSADLIGYGESGNKTMSYCCRHMAARNTVDAILAAQYMLKTEKLGNRISNYLPIYNVGYSQGGYDALALLRYMETEATPREKAAIEIKKTYCGAGPYDPSIYQEVVLSKKSYLYSPFMIMAIQSVLAYHSDKLKGYTLADFVSPRLMDCGLPEAVQSGKYTSEELIGMGIQALGSTNISDFFSQDLLNPASPVSWVLFEASRSESLVSDWQPQGAISFFSATNDDCVPVECTQTAEMAFGGLPKVSFTYSDKQMMQASESVHENAALTFFYSIFAEAPRWQ